MREFEVLGDRVVFAAGDARSNVELWGTRGVPGDAAGLRDIRPGNESGNPTGFTRLGDEILFGAYSPDGAELWTTDGTAGGTQQVRDISDEGSSNPTSLTRVGTRVYFVADDGQHGREVWVTDGSSIGTRLVQDVYAGSADGAPGIGGQQIAVANHLFFVGQDGASGYEPWISDGTAVGTRRIADLAPGADSSRVVAVGVLGSTVIFEDEKGAGTLWGYTVTPSRTVGPVKASYSRTQAVRRRVVVSVRVIATGARPTGTVVLTKGARVIGRASVVNGVARVRVAIRLAKGRHRLVAHYGGSVAATSSTSTAFVIRVR